MSLSAPGDTNPGRLDRRITIRSNQATRDAAGGVVPNWVDVATVWASKAPTRGGRLYAAESKGFEQFTDFTIRWRADVGVSQRIIHGAETYELISTQEIGRQRFLLLTGRSLPVEPAIA